MEKIKHVPNHQPEYYIHHVLYLHLLSSSPPLSEGQDHHRRRAARVLRRGGFSQCGLAEEPPQMPPGAIRREDSPGKTGIWPWKNDDFTMNNGILP